MQVHLAASFDQEMELGSIAGLDAMALAAELSRACWSLATRDGATEARARETMPISFRMLGDEAA